MSRYSETREMRLRQVERCLDSGMTIKEWCRLNNVAPSTLYVWLKVYREESQGQAKSHGDWIELTRQEVKDSKALAIKSKDDCVSHSDVSKQDNASFSSNVAIQVSLNGAGILIPSGCDDATIKSVLSAVATL